MYHYMPRVRFTCFVHSSFIVVVALELTHIITLEDRNNFGSSCSFYLAVTARVPYARAPGVLASSFEGFIPYDGAEESREAAC